MGHYSALKRTNILTLATTEMNHEDTMLSEIGWSKKGPSLYDPTALGFRGVTFTEGGSRKVAARGWRERMTSINSMCESQLWENGSSEMSAVMLHKVKVTECQ